MAVADQRGVARTSAGGLEIGAAPVLTDPAGINAVLPQAQSRELQRTTSRPPKFADGDRPTSGDESIRFTSPRILGRIAVLADIKRLIQDRRTACGHYVVAGARGNA